MSALETSSEPVNPFIPDRPAVGRHEFVGRADAIEWIHMHLVQSSGREPFTLCGASGIGKTSLLHRLVAGDAGKAVTVLYADFLSLNFETISAFLWDLAKAIMTTMEKQGVSGPSIEKRMLVLNPQLVFRQRFWQPLTSKAHAEQILLAWDNFDVLAERTDSVPSIQAIRAYMYSLLDADAPLSLLLTITGRVEAMAENSLSPFRLGHSYRLTNLSRSETMSLIHYADEFPIFDPVADFVYELTAGHPGDVQRLCNSLYNRHQARGQGQVTAADVLAVLWHELRPSDFVGPVHRRLGQSTFSLRMNGSVRLAP